MRGPDAQSKPVEEVQQLWYFEMVEIHFRGLLYF